MGDAGARGRPGDASKAVPVFFSKVLVISGSRVFRELLKLILDTHSEDVLIAGDRMEGRERLAQSNPVDVVICDVSLPDGNGFDLLDDVAAIAEARPEVILVASQPLEGDAQRARQMGAAGYLTKPVSFRHITSVLKEQISRSEQRALRRRHCGRVCLLGLDEVVDSQEGAHPQLLWYARDLSASGAFLETESPVPVGSRLDMTIEIGNIRVRVKAEVVRIQEPRWGRDGGVGIHFLEYGNSAQEALNAYIAEGGPDTY
jgi:DNA-binding response OmpR family regulator